MRAVAATRGVQRDRLMEVAAWVCGLEWEGIPEEVRAAASLHALDAIGVAVRSSRTPFGRGLLDGVARAGVAGPPSLRSTIIGGTTCGDHRMSALTNGALIHGLEFDDTHMGSVVHGSAVVLPAAIGSTEPEDATSELLAAYVAGWEVLVRLGLLAPGDFQTHGFQTAAVCGPLGAAATASRLRRRGPAATRNAMAIATSLAGGLMAYAADGANIKRIHLGWAAQSGIVACALSDWGVDGAAGALEGAYGFVKSFTGVEGALDVLGSLGSSWELSKAAFKHYPCCHYIHAYIDCALELRQRQSVEKIDKIECYVHPNVIPVIGADEVGTNEARDLSVVQYSLRLCVALAAYRGAVDLDALETISGDHEVVRLASRIEVVAAPWMEFPGSFGGSLRYFDDHGTCIGEAERKQPAAVELGAKEREAVLAKFEKNVRGVLDERDQQEVIGRLLAADGSRVAEWLPLLAHGA